MCGIFGYKSNNEKTLSNDILAKMSEFIKHRGPDHQSLYHDKSCGLALANNRLSIVDIHNGNQPFYSDDKKIIVIQNGEIFNFKEIKEKLLLEGTPFNTHCDTEVILRLYEKYGLSALQKLNGMFAIAIYDYHIDQLFLIRDRMGEKPLYYFYDGQILVFSSEIKGLLPAVNKLEVNYKAIELFFSCNFIPEPETIYQNIYQVPAGHYLQLSSDKLQLHEWWALHDKQQTTAFDANDWISAFKQIILDATRIRMDADTSIGAFLSGGVDSSTVVGLMSQLSPIPIKTFSIGFSNSQFDETTYALEAAERFKTEHTTKFFTEFTMSTWSKCIQYCDQPHGDTSFAPTLSVSELAAQAGIKVVLTGDGADELFAGYEKYQQFMNDSQTYAVDDIATFASRYAKTTALFSKEELQHLFSETLTKQCSFQEAETVYSDLLLKVPSWDPINQALYLDCKTLLPSNNLVKPDRMGMAVSIENRAPFLDFRMVEHAFNAPGEVKLCDGETKFLYKKAVSSLIGENLTYRKKQMFTVPIQEWIKHPHNPYSCYILQTPKALSRNFFNQDYISMLIEEHCKQGKNHTRKLRALIAFELWCQVHLDKV